MKRKPFKTTFGKKGKIDIKPNSTIIYITSESEYKRVEGKSMKLVILDEAEYDEKK